MPSPSKPSLYSIHDIGPDAEIIRDQTTSVVLTKTSTPQALHLPITSLAIFLLNNMCVFSLNLNGHCLKQDIHKNKFHITWHRCDFGCHHPKPSPQQMIFFQSQFLLSCSFPLGIIANILYNYIYTVCSIYRNHMVFFKSMFQTFYQSMFFHHSFQIYCQ